MFRHKKLSRAIIGVLTTSVIAAPAFSQGDENLEEVFVSGIQASLQKAMDIKRSSTGVVDAISSEDIGKFPDTNLAESLQRISGVSINRRDGEGAQVTVRGFGPQFNTVTLNGRQIPNATAGRGFNFDTIAAEMVSGVSVHKTSSAAVVSGGIGASINVTTSKPLELGDQLAGQVKMITDESSGNLTPGVSGLFSKNIDDKIGILFGFSYQERDFERDSIEVRRWREDSPLTSVDSNGDPITLQYHPTQHVVTHTEKNRKRTNANLVFQYAFNDAITGTLDAMYSDLNVTGSDVESASWRTYSTAEGEYWEADNNGTATFHQFIGRGMDFFVGAPESREINQQIGANLQWALDDQSTVVFDYAHNSSERNPDQEPEINRSDVQGVDLDYTFGIYGDSAYHSYDTADISLTSAKLHQMDVYSNHNLDELDQARVDYTFEGDSVSFKTGIMYTDQTKTLESYNNNNGENADAYTFRGKYDLVGETDALFASVEEAQAAGYSVKTIGHEFADEITYIDFPAEAAYTWIDLLSTDPVFGGLDLVKQTNWSVIEEETLSAYAEATVTGEVNNQPLVLVAGVRVEQTSVNSTSLEQTLERLEFVQGGEEFDRIYGDEESYSDGDGYDVVLPNMSIKYNFTDELIGRVAASKTITRPELGSMKSSRTYGGYRAGDDFGQASAGNPDLLPFVSDNFDLSLEWYVNDMTYLSAGYFKKVVDNFIVTAPVSEEIDGVFITDEIVDPDHPWDEEPIQAVYEITRPINQETKTVDGFELGGQHVFGESGFGVMGNVTLTDTDSPFEVDQQDASAILGLSDSANLVAFYDKNGFQARIAYNWRDAFLAKWNHFYSQSTNPPTQAEEFSQIDIMASYDITDSLTVFLEGINVTSEDYRTFGRYSNQMLTQSEGSARYALGVRAKF